MIKDLILLGKIPFLPQLKKFLYLLAWVAPLSVFVMADEFADFGEVGWVFLVITMSIRPLAQIFPGIGLLRSMMLLRREFGVFGGMMIVAHFSGFLITNNLNLLDVFTDKNFWGISVFTFWGLLGLILLIPVLVTSNKYMMNKLKSWKNIQRLSYLLFIFGGIHIGLVGEESGFIGVFVVVVLRVLSGLKLKVPIFQTRKA